MMIHKIELKTNKAVADIMKKCIQRYLKKSVYLIIKDKVRLSGNYWDSGSRSEWFRFNKITGEQLEIPASKEKPKNYWFADDPVVELTDDTILIEYGVFLGKPTMATIYTKKTIV